MSQLRQLAKQIAELDEVEREQLLFTLSEKLHPFIFKWFRSHHAEDYPAIVATPSVCGGAARLIRTRIPVWAIERMRQLGFSEIDILRSYPSLRAVDLVQAWSYADRHRNEIDKAIRENEENTADEPSEDARAAASARRGKKK